MATINKKISDTDYIEVGSTQGILNPAPVEYCTYTQNAAQNLPAATLTQITDFKWFAGKDWMNYTNNCFMVPEDGVYNIEFGLLTLSTFGSETVIMIANSSNPTQDNVLAFYKVGTAGTGMDGRICNCNICGYFPKNQTIYFFARAAIATTTNHGKSIVRITKISQNVPYLLSSKNGLVSDGVFQFDDDGKAYTENFPPVGVEWVVGKWINGKIIYRRSFYEDTIGDVNGLAVGVTKYIPLGIANIAQIITNQLWVRVLGISDINPLGSPHTASAEITENILSSMLMNGQGVYIKNNRSSAFASTGMDVRISGWCDYIKTI